MKTQLTKTPIVAGLWLAVFALLLADYCACAQTLVSGNISGTWSPSGNPYIVAGNCTVPAGTILTIQPGVIVTIGGGLAITNNGLIQAVGTPNQRITFTSPGASQYWTNIALNYADGTNRFKFCDFQNADTALRMKVLGGNHTMVTEIMNCTFSYCLSQAIYGESQSAAPFGGEATVSPVIKNCGFINTSNGCVMSAFGSVFTFSVPAYGNARIIGNWFKDMSGAALLMNANAYSGASKAIFINNSLVNCRIGVNSIDPWDATIRDNIFVGATNALKNSSGTGSTYSRAVGDNCFFGNLTNFTGYSSIFGALCCQNRNGTDCDFLSNIFGDPKFLGASDFHLAPDSPCIDAGTADWAFTDMCFPPSQGTSFPDLGAYGGPDACNWLDVVPLLPVTLTVSQTNGIGTLLWGALPRSTYRVQYVTNLATVGTNIWLDVTNILATDKPTSFVGSLNQPKAFYRVRSLGRTPGN